MTNRLRSLNTECEMEFMEHESRANNILKLKESVVSKYRSIQSRMVDINHLHSKVCESNQKCRQLFRDIRSLPCDSIGTMDASIAVSHSLYKTNWNQYNIMSMAFNAAMNDLELAVECMRELDNKCNTLNDKAKTISNEAVDGSTLSTLSELKNARTNPVVDDIQAIQVQIKGIEKSMEEEVKKCMLAARICSGIKRHVPPACTYLTNLL
jgi:hypothetical protein